MAELRWFTDAWKNEQKYIIYIIYAKWWRRSINVDGKNTSFASKFVFIVIFLLRVFFETKAVGKNARGREKKIAQSDQN